MKYGSHRISSAGDIALTSTDNAEYERAIEIINDWRSLHLIALDELQNYIVTLLKQKGIKPFAVSRRLKRLSSILNKLDRNPQSKLGTMQDIGGLRVVVASMPDLSMAYSAIVNNIPDNFELIKEPINYIESPKKESGYRSIHFVFKYHSSNSDVDGMKIELQLRTKLQHSWAMAVETAELITGTALKSSQGDENWIEYFKVISSLFALQEGTTLMEVHRDIKYPMKELMQTMFSMNTVSHFNDRLKALSVSTILAKKENHKDGYYILNINFNAQTVTIQAFSKENEELASSHYSELEKKTDEKINAVVLVSVPKIQQLQEAYPSYFLDTTHFLATIDSMMKDCQRKGWTK